jgi:hypothetical protein
MRTTILLSSLLFLAGSALAQDSPIRVGDSSSQQFPPPGKKTGTRGHSTYVQHKQFQSNGANHYVEDKDHKAGCFEVVGGPPRPPVSLLDQQWTLTLNDGVTLSSTDGKKVDIDYKGKPHVPHNAPNGDQQHYVTGDQLTSGDLLIDQGKPTTYPVSATAFTSPLTFKIHYCQIKSDGSLDCTGDTGKDTCK